MGPASVFLCLALVDGPPPAVDVPWTAGVPLWASLSPAGKVIDAGPVASWASPPPAARLGTRPEPLADGGPSEPRELPETLAEPAPMLPPGSPAQHFIPDAPLLRRTIRPASATSVSNPPAARLAPPIR